jgi:hypothetical protein
MPKQREGGITLSLASKVGEVEWFARICFNSARAMLKFLNDEYLEIRDRYPGEFALMANAHALEEACRPIVEHMISQGGAKAIVVASSYGDGSERPRQPQGGMAGGVCGGERHRGPHSSTDCVDRARVAHAISPQRGGWPPLRLNR